jgi:nucleoid-associated protein YgaU
MTSDAKIGLLLGLVFIFIIAFIINGLPRFNRAADNNKLTLEMLRSRDVNPGIGELGRQVARTTTPSNRASLSYDYVDPAGSAEAEPVRVTMPLPKSPAVVDAVEQEVRRVVPSPAPPVERKTVGPAHVEPVKKTVAPKAYVVAGGDNLTKIAKRFYGPEEGNRLVNIARIFAANRAVLKSPDEVIEGQKIVIPALSGPLTIKRQGEKVPGGSMFEKVKSIGRIYLPKGKPKVKPKAKASRAYIVKEDDNLWGIAARHLGDGNRYREIAKLNSDALEDEDFLTVGMRLQLPVR